MKKLVFLLLLTLTLTLTSCKDGSFSALDYDDFSDHKVSTFAEGENKSDEKYILYYYSELCSHCEDVKKELLTFFSQYDLLPFYLLDTYNATDVSSTTLYSGTPSIFVFSGKEIVESYIGSTKVRDFIAKYDDNKLDYVNFTDQQLTTYQSALDIQRSTYYLYYYLEECPHCNAVKEDFLKWAYTRNPEDIYFMNGAAVEDPNNVPTELIILNSGTPLLLEMSNGEFTGTYYAGEAEVIIFIEETGSIPFVQNTEYSYTDFSSHTITSYSEALTISDEPHLVYYYGETCSFCNSVKQEALRFFATYVHDFYLLEVYSATDTNNGITGVPTIAYIVNNEIAVKYEGIYEVQAFFQNYTNGDIDLSIYE